MKQHPPNKPDSANPAMPIWLTSTISGAGSLIWAARHHRACGPASSMSTGNGERAKASTLAVIVGVFLLGAVLGAWKDIWLWQDGRQATATIIGKGSKPGSFEYGYTING